PQDRQDAGPHRPASTACPRRRGHRVISRWTIVLGITGAALAMPPAARAQQNPGQSSAGRPARVGLLASERIRSGLLRGLHDAGYDEGRNLIVEYRPNDPAEMLARFATELVALNVDVIVAGGSQAVRAAQQATQRIPIVTTGSSDPVGT